MCLVWALAWFFLIADSPDTHSTISDEEYRYITRVTPIILCILQTANYLLYSGQENKLELYINDRDAENIR